MKKSTNDLIRNFHEVNIQYQMVNSMVLSEFDKIDIRISKRIRKKFMPKNSPRQKFSENEYFKAIIRNLGRQILICEEIHYEINKLDINPNVGFKIILEYFGKIDTLQEIQK